MKDEWISVESALPIEVGEYLTFSQGYDDPWRNGVSLDWFGGEKGRQLIWFSIREHRQTFGITHWQPLPAAPESTKETR